MFEWLKRKLGDEKLGSEVDRSVEERSVRTVVPIILPRACVVPEWPGPIVPLNDLPFAVAWSTIPSQNRFVYVTHEQAAQWDEQGIDWRVEAQRSLARQSEKRWSGYKDDEGGKPFLLVMLHDDAFGPSRLLLPHLFDDVLGPDYRVAIPEQTCAVAYRQDLTAEQKSDVDGVINGCFEHGTEPMSDQRFEPAAFWTLPEARVA